MSVSVSASQEVGARGLGLPEAAGTVPGPVHVGYFTYSLQQLCNCIQFLFLMAWDPALQQMLTICSVVSSDTFRLCLSGLIQSLLVPK